MRPDKHKQKKNEEYKKKHGIQQKSQKKIEEKVSTNKTGNEKVNEVAPTASSSAPSECCSTEYDDFDEKMELCRNNWEKFDMVETNEDDDAAGGNIDQILKDTANMAFQYQYKQQSFIEEIGDYTNLDEHCADLVSIDYSALSKLLLCIPLYRRLGIDENMFKLEDVEKMKEDAEKHMMTPLGNCKNFGKRTENDKLDSLFSSSLLTDSDKIFGQENQSTEEDKVEFLCNDESMDPPEVATRCESNIKKQNSSFVDLQKPAVVPGSGDKAKVNSLPNKHALINVITTSSKTNKKQTLAELEDELDALLEL